MYCLSYFYTTYYSDGNDDIKPADGSNNGLHPHVADTSAINATDAILVEQMSQMPASPQRVVVHMGSVSRKLRQRLFQVQAQPHCH